MTHLEERMQADLDHIRDWVWKIGEDVEKSLREAKKTLVLRDEELAFQTVMGDQPINRASRECDRFCHLFIARYLPGAGNLREMAATIRVNVSLERIGDYAVTISREAIQPDVPLPEKFTSKLDALADDTIDLLAQSRISFRTGNAEQAVVLMKLANRVQSSMDSIYEELFAEDDRMDAVTMMAIFVVFNLLKRVADQAKNISEQTVYSVRGIAKIPRVYRYLFLDQPGSDLAQLAVAIGRKNFPESAFFTSAIAGEVQNVSSELDAFLQDTGLPNEGLETETLAALEHDFADFTVIVSLNGVYSDYIAKIPFHTSALNWSLSEAKTHEDQYRLLRSKVMQLVTLIAGDEAS